MLGSIQKDIAEYFFIEISDDKMSAALTIKKPDDDVVKNLSLIKVFNILDRAGIKSGLKRELITQILAEKKWAENFVIAEGTEPIEGEAAQIEFYFQTDKSLKPKIDEQGFVDYKEVCMVMSVNKGAALIKKTPPTKGIPGKDIAGNELPAPKGKDIELNVGKGTYWDPEDETILRAAFDGIIFYNPYNERIEVQQIFTVQGSVDYSTGNINVKSIVDIKGDIKAGFTVTTPYNVFVKGMVENAIVSCGGSLKVRAGIIGTNNQLIKVGGDLCAGYINNQNIFCEGSIFIGSEIRNSKIQCGNDVVVEKLHGIIIGGSVTAVNKINAAYIGNSYHVITEINVGMNSKVGAVLEKIVEEQAALEKQMNNLVNQITQIAQKSPQSVFDSRLTLFSKQWNESVKRNEKLKAEIQELEGEYYNSVDPVVEVTKKIYPGTRIKIKQIVYEIKEELSRVKFSLVDDNIVITPLSD